MVSHMNSYPFPTSLTTLNDRHLAALDQTRQFEFLVGPSTSYIQDSSLREEEEQFNKAHFFNSEAFNKTRVFSGETRTASTERDF